MNEVSAVRYDGNSSASQTVGLSFLSDGTALVKGDGISLSYAKQDVIITSQIGGVHARVKFSDNSVCEISDHRALEAILPNVYKRGQIHQWENSIKYAFAALAITIAIIWGGIEFVLPVAAKNVAEKIPLEWETAMGEQTLAGFEKISLFEPSKLTQQRQQALREKFNTALSNAGVEPLPKILFRYSKPLEVNALALPSGIIVFTDDMVNFAEDDRELIGILGHEYGHVQYRHIMRHVLQNSALALFIIMITGDVGSLSALASAMPLLLTQAKYSRQFEIEADAASVIFLQKQNIDRRYLSSILKRLGEQYEEGESTGYLDSHPATAERIQALEGG